MNPEKLKARVNELISKARTKQAMDLLWEHAPALQDDLIQLRARFNDNEKKNRMGLLGSSDYRIENNRIVSAFLSIVGELGQETSYSAPPKQEQESEPGGIQKILFLASNPQDTGRLQLGLEVREIEESLRLSKHRDSFKFIQKHEVRTRDLRRAMLDEEPQIVHFSGHGYSDTQALEEGKRSFLLRDPKRPQRKEEKELGIILTSNDGKLQEVENDALAGLFGMFDSIQCVFLNACYAGGQAEALLEHVPYVVGYKDAIQDKAAITFASSFYDALASGKDIPFSFKFAKGALKMEGMKKEAEKAILLSKEA